jgi:hypothetical protein
MTISVPKIYLIVILVLLLSSRINISIAQEVSFEDFKKQYTSSFTSYQDSVNNAFEGFLKSAWIEINNEQPTVTYIEPKPKSIPSLIPIPKKPTPSIPENDKETKKSQPDLSPDLSKAPVISPPTSAYGLVFFGKFWEISFLEGSRSSLKSSRKAQLNKEYFNTQWEILKVTYDSEKLAALKKLLAEQTATDWSSFLFIQQWISEEQAIAKTDRDLHLWFIMQQLGYDFRIGYSNNKTLVLASFDKPLYGITYYTFGDKKYYIVQNEEAIEGPIKTYNGALGKNITWLEPIPYAALDQNQSLQRKLSFPYRNTNYEVQLQLYPEHIAYQEKILRSKPEFYASFEPSNLIAEQLDVFLKPILNTLSIEDQLNFLLAMVQLSFDYQTDNEQFGYEKFMTPEECLWNTASDCEDRTALFAWLVGRYTQHDYRFVRYPTHIALAINTNKLSVHTSNLTKYKDVETNDIFIVADPTYMGASVGMEMPKLLNKGTLIDNH